LSTEEIADGNPLAEGLVQARAVAELATLIMAGLTASIRLREQRLQVHRGNDIGAHRAEIEASHVDAQVAWEPGLTREFTRASSRQAAAVWVSAEPWAAYNPDAREAMRRAEARLAALYPEPMANYNQRQNLGADRFDAMAGVVSELQERARVGWAPSLEPDFAEAGGPEAAAVWVAAEPWAVHDPEAREAMRRAEERLAVLYPGPMANYKQRRAAGADRFDAMSAVAAQLRRRTRSAEPVRIYGDEVSLGWHRVGSGRGAEREATSGARVAALAAQAFPRSMRAALANPTKALAGGRLLRLGRGRGHGEE
jgi:hypothetical protein